MGHRDFRVIAMPRSLADLEADLRRFDALLRPIAKQRLNPADPNAFQRMMDAPPPLDRAGVRQQAQDLLISLIKDYARADPAWRTAVRDLLRRHDTFLWATPLPSDARTPQGFRAHLIRFALADQEKDPRDAKLAFDDLVQTARSANLDVAPILREIAALCAETDPYGWGSTRQWLEKAAAGL